MNIYVVAVGSIKEKFFVDAIGEYKKRLSRYCKYEIIEVKDEKKKKLKKLRESAFWEK